MRCFSSAGLLLSVYLCMPLLLIAQSQLHHAPAAPSEITIQWGKVEAVSHTGVSIQVCPEPPLLRGRPIHDQLFKALHDLNADFARLQPWYPYPTMSVAELKPPSATETYWNFGLMDEYTSDFMKATAGHPVVFDFGTLPQWMFKTNKPVKYAENPETIDWKYSQGTVLRDPSLKEATDYQARLWSWFTQGGFQDELGHWHASGHHYNIAYWEILNEIDAEHKMTPELYTRFYDETAEKILKISPNAKFMGMALADPTHRPDFIQYFLNPRNHKPGVPLNAISFHFYSMPDPGETIQEMQYTIFDEADNFLTSVRYIESNRKYLSFQTKTDIDEVGSMLPGNEDPRAAARIPKGYWNLAAAMWAYLFGHLTALGVDEVGIAELIDYPGQVPATTLVNWQSGDPNARYWVAKLLHDNFGPNDRLVQTAIPNSDVFAQAYVTPTGVKKILLVNKRNKKIAVALSGASGGTEQRVDETTAPSPPVATGITSDTIVMPQFAVEVLTLSSAARSYQQ